MVTDLKLNRPMTLKLAGPNTMPLKVLQERDLSVQRRLELMDTPHDPLVFLQRPM